MLVSKRLMIKLLNKSNTDVHALTFYLSKLRIKESKKRNDFILIISQSLKYVIFLKYAKQA